MLVTAVSFICGIAVHKFLPFFPFTFTALLIFLFLYLYRFNRRRFLIIAFVLFSGIIYGFIRHGNTESTIPPDDAYLIGTIIDVPEVVDERMRFTVDDVFINDVRADGKVKLSFNIHNVREYPILQSGERISALVSLRDTGLPRNPGVYSYDLKEDGILAWGSVSGLKVLDKDNGIIHMVNRLRQRLGWIMERSLSPESASFHKAIIPGLKGSINQDMRDDFSSTGLAHILSISGTHFGLLAFILFKTVRMIVRLLPIRILNRITLYMTPSQIAVLLTMPVLLLYTGISGASTPTIRSLVMISIFMFALFIGRKDQWINSLSIAAIIILLWDPATLFEVSFQLSFLAVLSIGLVLERKGISVEEASNTNIIKGVSKRLKTASLITISATLGTAPLVVLFFKQFPLISPLTNLLITPLVCFIILPLGFFSGFTALLFNMTSLPFNYLINSITQFTLDLIAFFSDIPYASVHLSNPSVVMMVLYFLSLFFIIRGRHRWRFLPAIIVIMVFIVRPYIHNHEMRITFLDVGQGDSSVIELPDRRVMLVDGGSENNDSGRRVVAPYLWSRGIRNIDILVMSHPHYDHYGGLIYILDNFDVKEVWVNGRFVQGSEAFFERLIKKRIPYRILRRGDAFVASGYQIIVLHPYDEYYAGSERGDFSDENSDSLVLRIKSGEFSALLTGDIESEAEDNIVHLGAWLRSDIIKVPHHGGRTSSSKNFIRVVDPDVAVISAGRYNLFKHPHMETINRYRSSGVKIYRTDNDGAVIITLKGNGYSIKTYEDSRLKRAHGLYDEIRNLLLLL